MCGWEVEVELEVQKEREAMGKSLQALRAQAGQGEASERGDGES